MSAINNQILSTMQSLNYGAYTSYDFLELGNYKNISKSLETLEDNKAIGRIIRGVYYLNKYDEVTGLYEKPSIEDIAYAIARQYNYIIIPSGNLCLNIIGISSQIPSEYVFSSSGPYREYNVGSIKIKFKHVTSKELTLYSKNILIAVQAFKTLGKENIDQNVINKINSFLNKEDKKQILEKRNNITNWIYSYLKKIAED